MFICICVSSYFLSISKDESELKQASGLREKEQADFKAIKAIDIYYRFAKRFVVAAVAVVVCWSSRSQK